MAGSTPAPRVDPESPEGAVQVLRDYYAAINARDHSRAYQMWENDGRASGQTLAEFEAGFADLRRVEAQVGTRGRLGAAAGSRYVEVPVTLTAETTAGRTRRFQGTVTLRRAVVDGATPKQRRWHLYTAEMAELSGGGAVPTPSDAATAGSPHASEVTPCTLCLGSDLMILASRALSAGGRPGQGTAERGMV